MKHVEQSTAAELVVAVRPTSGHYRHSDLAVGAAVAALALCVFLYHPASFDFTYLPLELALAFALGTVLSITIAPLRRLVTRRSLMDEAVATAARSTFVELCVHRTRARTGILVLISSFERRAEIVSDVGVPIAELGSSWTEWCERVRSAVKQRRSPELVEALRALGPLLAQALPASATDENELCDEPSESAA